MLHPWLAIVRRNGKLYTPVGCLKKRILFTFVLLCIKFAKLWKTLQLLRPNSLLVIKGFLLTLSSLVKRLAWIHLLPIPLFPSKTLFYLFPTNHWSKRVSTCLSLPLITLFSRRVVIILLMFFSSPQILMNQILTLSSKFYRRVFLLFLQCMGAIIWCPHQVVLSSVLIVINWLLSKSQYKHMIW